MQGFIVKEIRYDVSVLFYFFPLPLPGYITVHKQINQPCQANIEDLSTKYVPARQGECLGKEDTSEAFRRQKWSL